MKTRIVLLLFTLGAIFIMSSCNPKNKLPDSKPNIILILVDDLGYGDVSCYNEHSRINTPNIDRLADEGIKFTDAHTSAAQCSPTRYGLLTGRYAWRTRLKHGVLPHFDQPLIDHGRSTLASLFKEEGYATACVGKWHLGLGWHTNEGDTIDPRSWSAKQNLIIDYSKTLTSSPNNYGFDYFYGINASNNMLPYCLIENNRVISVPDTLKYPVFDTEDGIGLVASDYDSELLESTLFSKAMAWLSAQKDKNPKQPFFLYYPMSAIHRPCLPVDGCKLSSEAGLRGDKVVEVDHLVGELTSWLKENKLEKNTLVIFTSDNGGRPGDQFHALRDLATNDYGNIYHPAKLIARDSLLSINNPYDKPKGAETYHIYRHFASGPFKGYKFDIYEGGHRVPFIIKWPGVVRAGETSTELVSTLDFMATFADMLKTPVEENCGEDSYSFLPLLLGSNHYTPRPYLIHKAWRKNTQAIRKGNWKLIPYKNGGGIYKFPDVAYEGQLYNLEDDPGETNNLYNEFPEIVEELSELLTKELEDQE